MKGRSERQSCDLHARRVFMDCRVKPGNDTERVKEQHPEL
jgi:hypothetical protein